MAKDNEDDKKILEERIKLLEDKRNNQQTAFLEGQINALKAELALRLESTKELLNSKNASTNDRITTYKNCFSLIITTVSILFPLVGFFIGKDFIKRSVENKVAIFAEEKAKKMIEDYENKIDERINNLDKKIDDVIARTEKKVEKKLSQIFEKVEKSDRIEGTSEFEKWYDLGAGAFSNKRYEKAISYFLEALKTKPDKLPAAYTYNYLGTASVPLGKLDEEIKYYSDAIRLFPEYVIAHQNRGIIYYSLGNQEKAFSDFNKLSELYIDKGEYEKASNNIEGTLSLLEKADIDNKKLIEEKINELKKKLEGAKPENPAK